MGALCLLLESVASFFSNILGALHRFLDNNGFYGSFLAAMLGAIILFFIKEFFNPSKKINGEFYVLLATKESSWNPYKGMVVERQIILFSDGHEVKGSCEKTREKAKGKGIHEYRAADRVRGEVNGFIERNYMRSSRLHLHIVEDNPESRKSTSYATANLGWGFFKLNAYEGTFYSTAGDSAGTVKICKEKPGSLSI